MKISILTFAKGDNYGAVLQAYALGHVLQGMGYDVEYISLTWTTWIHSILSRITPLRKRFQNFRKKYLINFSKNCVSFQDLRDSVSDTDICIVGSDQVWNPDITTVRALYYFFDFVPYSIPRISYAASFGVDKWKWENLTPKVELLLKKFHSISVREDSGVAICKLTFDVHATKVLDPTLLLENYDNLLKKPLLENYVLGFKFVTSPEYYSLLNHVASDIEAAPLIMDMLPRNLRYTHFGNTSFFPSPEQWVTNVAYSKFVITDSFHCTAFSLIFKKNFMVILPKRLGKVQGRLYSLLKELGLENRIYTSIEDAKESNIWDSPINYDIIDKKLSDLRTESLKYLTQAISSAIKQ